MNAEVLHPDDDGFTPTVLFVDDEQNILQGLRRLLYHRRKAWQMYFAADGEEALSILKTTPVDIVVSDMRMPGMDGATLLARIAELYPGTIRFVLSGQSDLEATFRAAGPCHQYLPKPVDGRELETRILRSLALRRRLGNPDLRRAVGRLRFLPTPPRLYNELMQLLQSNAATNAAIAAIVAKDPAIAAKVMQIANSAFFGRAHDARTLEQAVMFLGWELIKTLLITYGLAGQHRGTIVAQALVDKIITDSTQAAALARSIAIEEKEPSRVSEDAFLAALLHDVGMLTLIEATPESYRRCLIEADRAKRPLVEVETATIGASHAEIGAYLLGTWGLPDTIVEAVAYHHDDNAGLSHHPPNVRAVHIAVLLVEESANPAALEAALAHAPELQPRLAGLRKIRDSLPGHGAGP